MAEMPLPMAGWLAMNRGMSRGFSRWLLLLSMMALVGPPPAHAQLDPVKRRLIQLGYNQAIQGHAPIGAYGFYYHNQPNFYSTNLTLRLAASPVYLDASLGFSHLLGPDTDFALGLAGGGFADSYAEIRQGVFRSNESFSGEASKLPPTSSTSSIRAI